MRIINREMAVGSNASGAVEALDLSVADGSLLLAPYGETPYWHLEKTGGNTRWRCYRQIFGRAQAERMVAAFNALAARKGAGFRGLPVYAGHPDADPVRWPDERRLGGIVALEARGDGLYARAAWNDLGEQNRAQGYLVYPSPAWLYDQRAARESGVIAPDELRSVGLTNTPRLPDVPAWTNGEEGPTAELDQPAPEPMHYKPLLLALLGLPEDASEEGIRQTHDAARQAADDARASATSVCAERDRAREEAGRFRAAAINAHLDAAVEAGRLSAAERVEFVERFAQDFEATMHELAERRPALDTRPLGLRPLRPGVDLSTAHGRAAAFNARLDALMRPAAGGGRGLRFDAALTEMRANPEDAALLRAMEGR